jgi:hypothetical protein
LKEPRPDFNGKTRPLTVWATDYPDLFDVCVAGEVRGQMKRYVPEGAKTVAWRAECFPKGSSSTVPFVATASAARI